MKKNKMNVLHTKTMSVFMYCLTGILLTCSTISFSGCGKDPVTPPTNVIKLLTVDQTSLALKVGDSLKVTIKTGNSGYAVAIDQKTFASVTLKDTIVVVKGLAPGTALITITDKESKSIKVTVIVSKADTPITTQGVPMNTIKKYDMTVLSGEKGAGVGWSGAGTSRTGTILISRTDYMGNVNTSTLTNDEDTALKEFFTGGYCDDPNAFICMGYSNIETDMGYAAPCLVLTNTDDPNHAGMKKIIVLATNTAAAMEWAGYSQKVSSSWAYFDPTDSSFTVYLVGYLGWGYDFVYNRKYTPVK